MFLCVGHFGITCCYLDLKQKKSYDTECVTVAVGWTHLVLLSCWVGFMLANALFSPLLNTELNVYLLSGHWVLFWK